MTNPTQIGSLALALCLAAASAERAPASTQSPPARPSAVAVGGGGSPSTVQADRLPSRLTDQEFWRLVVQFSEPNGFFDSDNLVSNEDTFQAVIPELKRGVPPGGVYLGVGPDQNFAYIVAVAPKLSFITDIRRGNLHLHLMYKALIELSVDRADFLSRLFSRRRPAGLGPASTVIELFRAYRTVVPDRASYEQNVRAIIGRLTASGRFALADGDAPGIEMVYSNFYRAGPDLRFISSRPGNRYPSFEDLQNATDGQGVHHGYLTGETEFRKLRALQQANLIVPVVGNFAGPRALRAIGHYLRANGATVSVFYTSNVERYLFQDRLWADFAENVSALPLDDTSTFIRSCFDSCSSFGGARSVTLLDSMMGLVRDAKAGRVSTYSDVLSHSRWR